MIAPMSLPDSLGITRKITRPRLDAFLAKHASDAQTLDIGSGNNQYGKYFPNRTTVDIEQREGIDIDIIGDAHDLHMIDNESFDVILCTEVLEHLHTPAKAIAEFRRILKPKGTLILTTRFIYPLHDVPGDYYRYTKYGLEHLLQDFEIEELQEETNTVETLAVLYQRIGFQCDTLWLKPCKLLWFLKAMIVKHCSWLITKEYGDIGHKKEEQNILSSGYYVAARKT